MAKKVKTYYIDEENSSWLERKARKESVEADRKVTDDMLLNDILTKIRESETTDKSVKSKKNTARVASAPLAV